MTTSITDRRDNNAGLLGRLETHVAAQRPDWFGHQRQAAVSCFRSIGLPTTRDEDWRFTNTAPIRELAFESPGDESIVSPKDISSVSIPGLDGSCLVFVNGRFEAELSELGTLPPGVKVLSLADAFASQQALLQKHLGQLAAFDHQPFTALNTALTDDGVVVVVPAGLSVQEPIYVLNLSVATTGKPLWVNPRNLIVTGANAAVTLIEDYVSLNGGVYLNNAVTEVIVGDNADVTHYLIERDSREAFNISSLHARQGRDSRFASHAALFGGAIVRNNVNPVLDGQGCDSLLNGLYIADGKQTIDNHMTVVHAKAHCDSRQFYRGIMNDHGKGVFRGRIVVRPGAQKTDAKQSNQNLLLSDDAAVNTDPQLEIYADDVKCTHGATVGQINQEQVFYLQSRGIPLETARAMIIYAFASESLERMTHQPIRQFLKAQLLHRLPAGRVLEQSL